VSRHVVDNRINVDAAHGDTFCQRSYAALQVKVIFNREDNTYVNNLCCMHCLNQSVFTSYSAFTNISQ
jgi:hypothetical protein